MSSTIEHQSHDRTPAPDRDAPEQAERGREIAHGGMLGLQKSAGNQAVNHLLDHRSDHGPGQNQGHDPRDLDDPLAVRERLGHGQPLQGSVRYRMEQAFGASFSHVRLHTGSDAGRIVRHHGAEALTVGEHIAMKQEHYRPGTLLGDALLAHELAHTLQQQGATTSEPAHTYSRSHLERDADARAAQALIPEARHKGLREGLEQAGGHLRSGLQLQFFACGKAEKTEEEKYEELKESLSDTESAVRAAQRIYEAQGDTASAQRAGQIADTFGNVNRNITRAEQAVQLYEAVGDLQAFAEADPNADPEGFARSAGRAFVRFGEALELAPPPLDSYGTFLKGMEDFFVDMAGALRPDMRYRGTPYEQYMR